MAEYKCRLKILCVDCENEYCRLVRKKAPNCPHEYCPYPHLDCETECRFIDGFIEMMRRKNECNNQRDEEAKRMR